VRPARRATFAAACAAWLALAAPAGAAGPARAADPPLNLAADNVTGSHGPEGDVVLLHGNLRITRAGSVLTADDGRYLRAQGMLYLDGRVRMVDSTTTLTCDHASYSESDDVLQVVGNVVVVDRDATLAAPTGTYYRKTGIADLFGGVTGHDGDQRLVCDRATYVRDSMLVKARGAVRGFDDKHKLELQARAIDYDRARHLAVATGEPVLLSRDDQGKATEVHAVVLRVDTEARTAEALDSVRVQRDTLRARADYARFDDRANRGWLLGTPRAWDDHTAMSGDSLELWTEERKIQRLIVTGHAIMDYLASRPPAVGESSRLTSSRAEVFFTKDQIDSLVATGGAKNLYTAPPQAGKTAEHNEADGDTITVFFTDRKIDRARVEGNAKGEYDLAVSVGDTTAAKKEIVKYDAARIHFVVPKSRIVLDRAAHLVYRDLELKARRVEYDVERQTLVASGQPDLIDRGDRVTGHLMTYDMTSRIGTIYQAQTAYERGLYHGERIRKVGDNVLDVMQGSYSTCDLEQPHYHFAAHWMKIYLKDKLVAKPVVFYIENVPLLALPFWIFPIKPGRHSGFLFPQFEFGFSNSAGQFLRNAGYYWAPNDYMDLTLSGDYYQAEPSWVMRAEGVYKLLYVLDGQFHGTLARNERLGREDWDFTANHSQEITPRTRAAAQASFVSSRDYSTSNLYGRTLSQRLNRFLTSNLSISHNADWASISAALDRRQDLDADAGIADPDGRGPLHGRATGTLATLANLTETTPSAAISFPTRTVGAIGPLQGTFLEKPLSTLYFSLSSRFTSQHERRAFVAGQDTFSVDGVPDSVARLGQRITTRRALGSSASLSDSRRLLGWLNLQPHIDADMVVFDFDEQGHRIDLARPGSLTSTTAGVWRSGVTTSATFYGTFRPRLGPLIGLRHVVTPSVSYSYSPEFTNLSFTDARGFRVSRFNSFGGFGVSGFKQSFMSFGLDQRLQVKLKHGDKIERLDNLISFSTRGSYNYLWREQRQKHGLSTLGSSLFLQPPGLLNATFGWTTDIYEPHPVRNLGFNTGLNLSSAGRRSANPDLPVDQQAPAEPGFREPWTLGLAYSYSGGYVFRDLWTSNQTANAVLQYKISPGWGLDYSSSADLTHRRVLTQRFGLSRDLHCWIVTFSRTFTTGGEAEYYFRLGVKDQREIYIERGTRTGSIGGIQ
jgi:lipopolysaccharide assembly outer membrane protein LptD (OstA)